MITSALFTTKKPTPTNILVIGKRVSLAVNSCDFAVFALKTPIFLEKVGEMVFFFGQRWYFPTLLQNDLRVFRRTDQTDVFSNHHPSTQRSDRIPRFLPSIEWKNQKNPTSQLTFWLVTLKPGKCFHNHRWSPISERTTSVISLCVLGTAANPVLRRVYPCLHACCRNCQRVSSDTNVCGPQCSFFIKEAFSCQTSRLVYCISYRCCLAIYIGETGRTRRQHFGEHNQIIEKNLPTDTLVHGIMLCGENVQYKGPEMRLIFQLDTSHPSGLNSDFRFL